MTAISDKIAATIRALDPEDDSLWTQDGLPRIDVVAKAAGMSGLTRSDLNGAGSGLDRESLRAAAAPAVPSEAAASTAQESAQPTQEPAKPQDDPDAPLADLGEQPDTSLDGPHRELKLAQDILEQKRSELNAAQQAFDEQVQHVDRLLVAVEQAAPLETTMDSIQMYLESQKRQRELKAARSRQLSEAGVSLKELGALTNVRSPLDQAMARAKRGR